MLVCSISATPKLTGGGSHSLISLHSGAMEAAILKQFGVAHHPALGLLVFSHPKYDGPDVHKVGKGRKERKQSEIGQSNTDR